MPLKGPWTKSSSRQFQPSSDTGVENTQDTVDVEGTADAGGLGGGIEGGAEGGTGRVDAGDTGTGTDIDTGGGSVHAPTKQDAKEPGEASGDDIRREGGQRHFSHGHADGTCDR